MRSARDGGDGRGTDRASGLLRRFEPAALEQRMQAGRLDTILPAARKARTWELFCATYKEIAREAEDDFQAVFGREFAAPTTRRCASSDARTPASARHLRQQRLPSSRRSGANSFHARVTGRLAWRRWLLRGDGRARLLRGTRRLRRAPAAAAHRGAAHAHGQRRREPATRPAPPPRWSYASISSARPAASMPPSSSSCSTRTRRR